MTLLDYIEVELQEHKQDNEPGLIKRIKPKNASSLKAKIPRVDTGSPFSHTTKRMKKGLVIKFTQFPINISNCRTVHKLQGRSIKNLMVSSYDYTDNWIYVVLSRVTTIEGLFLMSEINHKK